MKVLLNRKTFTFYLVYSLLVLDFQFFSINSCSLLKENTFQIWKISSTLCSFCKTKDETPVLRLFLSPPTNQLFNELKSFCSDALLFPLLTSQNVILGISTLSQKILLLNLLLLIFKYVYYARKDCNLSIEILEMNTHKTKNIEKKMWKNDIKI